MVYLDFAKAFDSVPHNELLVKLRSIGVGGDLWLWLQAYLSRRQQCVCLDKSRSELLPVISGVPQGAILGPLLFLIYVNDLVSSPLSSRLLAYADDLKCSNLIRELSDCARLQEDLDGMTDWSHKWKINFKAVKCVHLQFSRGSTNFNQH